MKRRDFFKNGSLFTFGSLLVGTPSSTWTDFNDNFKNKKAKNIIFLVSDGMSSGTLNMADKLLYERTGRGSHWLNLYREGKITRALMDTASANSLITDSAAASSAWGGGKRVPNGALNINADGSENLPILQKFKKAGKKVGCVTTVPITHATPAGFCIMQKQRGDQDSIAEKYAKLDFDVMMGGGNEYFSAENRRDGKNIYKLFEEKNYSILRNRDHLNSKANAEKILGIFADGGLPYALDRENDEDLRKETPSLAEMSKFALQQLSRNNKEGFVLQIEAGKVDWAAHANDSGGLLYDQIAFDKAVKEAINFAENSEETLVIITTDHGNANPGILKGEKADRNFSNLQGFTHTNEWILQQLNKDSGSNKIREVIAQANVDNAISKEESKDLAKFYNKRNGGLYNSENLPYAELATMQREYTSVGWMSMDHTGDYVELSAYGPGSETLKPFIKNHELHAFLLTAAEVKDNF